MDVGFSPALTASWNMGSVPLFSDTVWTRAFGGEYADRGYSVAPTADSGYIIAGSTYSFGSGAPLYGDVYLIKTDASGETLWTRSFGGTNSDEGWSVQPTADGGYIVTGYSRSPVTSADVYLIKTNAAGDTIWTRTYGGTSEDRGYSVQQTRDSGYIIAGQTYSFGAGTPTYDNVYLIKTNASGDTVWTRTFGGLYSDQAGSVWQTADGGYIIAGSTYSFGSGAPSYGDVYLIRTDASGDTLWTRTYGGESYDEGYSVQPTVDSGYIVAGYADVGSGNYDVFLVKADAQGDTVRTRTYGGSGAECANSVIQTADGGFVVAGYTYSFGAGNQDVYLVKTDSLGGVGVAEESPKPQAISRRPAATAVRNLPPGATTFDATGRRVLHPKPGVYFLRTVATASPRKVLLVE
jgi:hypothetical protein